MSSDLTITADPLKCTAKQIAQILQSKNPPEQIEREIETLLLSAVQQGAQRDKEFWMKKYDLEYRLRKSCQSTLEKIQQKVSTVDGIDTNPTDPTRKTEVKIVVHKPMEESTVTATVKNFSDGGAGDPPSLESSRLFEIRRLLAETIDTNYRPTLEHPTRTLPATQSQEPAGEVALLRSTINTMKKQGYFLTKNHDFVKQENLSLRESNAKLEKLVTTMEDRMEKMTKETLEAKNKCEKVLFNSMVHESILIERIDGLQKLNKSAIQLQSETKLPEEPALEVNLSPSKKKHRQQELAQKDALFKEILAENERLQKMVNHLQQERQEFIQAFSAIETVEHSVAPDIKPFQSNRMDTEDSAILAERERMFVPDNRPQSHIPKFKDEKDFFNSFRESKAGAVVGVVEETHTVKKIRTESLVPDPSKDDIPAVQPNPEPPKKLVPTTNTRTTRKDRVQPTKKLYECNLI